MEHKIQTVSKYMTLIGLCVIIFQLFQLIAGLNTLNAIQNDQRAISSELRDNSNILNCYTFNADKDSFTNCIND